MSNLWMKERYRKRIFYQKSELSFLYTKWSLRLGTNNGSIENFINIFLSNFMSNNLLIVFRNRFWSVSCLTSQRLTFDPLSPTTSNLLESKWSIIHTNCFIISIRRETHRKEFSPFSCRSHMLNHLPGQHLVFLRRIRFIEETIFTFFHTYTSKTIFARNDIE